MALLLFVVIGGLGLAGDEVELVALDVGERGPLGAVAHDFVELGSPERE
jgi:hypothetical protein